MAVPNPNGRPRGAKNKHTIASVNERLDRMEALQREFIASIATGSCPPFATVEDALGCVEFLAEGVASGRFERAEAERHIAQLRAFVEATAKRNFMSFSAGRFI
jgi:hypothetical protein